MVSAWARSLLHGPDHLPPLRPVPSYPWKPFNPPLPSFHVLSLVMGWGKGPLTSQESRVESCAAQERRNIILGICADNAALQNHSPKQREGCLFCLAYFASVLHCWQNWTDGRSVHFNDFISVNWASQLRGKGYILKGRGRSQTRSLQVAVGLIFIKVLNCRLLSLTSNKIIYTKILGTS